MTVLDHGSCRLRVLVIGSFPPPIGGTSVSLETLTRELKRHDEVAVVTLNTGGIRGRPVLGFYGLVALFFKIIVYVFRVDVMSVHLSNDPFPFLGPFAVLASRLSRTPLILRRFGGCPFAFGKLRSWLTLWAVRHADAYLLQTRMLMREAQSKGLSNLHWYPTSRPRPEFGPNGRALDHKCQRFVFIGHVKREKGIVELIEAAEYLPEQVSVDVYGPFTGDLSEKDFEGKRRIAYRGILEPEKVCSTLIQYDALALPTYHFGEGYPGVVIEAFMTGLPVVCTRWQALPEIVDETCGILVPPHDAIALRDAMLSLVRNEDLFHRLCAGSRDKANGFCSDFWAGEFVKICRELVQSRK